MLTAILKFSRITTIMMYDYQIMNMFMIMGSASLTRKSETIRNCLTLIKVEGHNHTDNHLTFECWYKGQPNNENLQ